MISSEHAGGADDIDLTYNSNGTATVEDAAGASRTYAFQAVHDVNHVSSATGGSCAACGISSGYTYNSAGDLIAWECQKFCV